MPNSNIPAQDNKTPWYAGDPGLERHYGYKIERRAYEDIFAEVVNNNGLVFVTHETGGDYQFRCGIRIAVPRRFLVFPYHQDVARVLSEPTFVDSMRCTLPKDGGKIKVKDRKFFPQIQKIGLELEQRLEEATGIREPIQVV